MDLNYSVFHKALLSSLNPCDRSHLHHKSLMKEQEIQFETFLYKPNNFLV